VTDRVALRDVYGAALPEFGHRYPTLAVLDADLATSTRTAAFRKEFPDRHLNVGIAEQNMVGMAAGIALAGGMPAVNTFAAFLSRRAADQIAISVAYPNLNVKFFGFHAGISLGEDGATQQAVEDLGIMQAIPNIRVYAPLDAVDLRAVMEEVFSTSGPTYVRLARFPSPPVDRLPGPASEHRAPGGRHDRHDLRRRARSCRGARPSGHRPRRDRRDPHQAP
jgi:transketolase